MSRHTAAEFCHILYLTIDRIEDKEGKK